MDKNNYFIKKGYQSQAQNRTLSIKKGDLYWTPERIKTSGHYQYEAYVIAGKLIKDHGLKSVVDIGCGVATKLMKVIWPVCHEVTGIDQKEAVDYCLAHYPRGKFLVDNLEKPTLRPGQFDLVICADVIEHLTNPDNLIAYIKRLSNKNSYVVLSTPERDVLRGQTNTRSPKPEHVREWNREELKAYLESRGLKVISQSLIPVAKSSWLNKEILATRKNVRKEAGTLNINQLVVCRPTG